MITRTKEKHQSAEQLGEPPSWQHLLANGISSLDELLAAVHLTPEDFEDFDEELLSDPTFPLRVPRGFVARMRDADPNDPLLLQVLPKKSEQNFDPSYVADPLNEIKNNPTPGLLHKYHGRVLLTVTGACAINCRYCFRQHFPYDENNPGSRGWDATIQYLKNNPNISEVILSGGDPLVLSDRPLIKLMSSIVALPQITRLRLHTRLPIVLPERITDTLLQWFENSKTKIVLVVHCNHANEMNKPVRIALKKLKEAQVILLNQSVLLRGVNDNAKSIIDLSEALFAADVLPYYLHLLDKVAGAAHFDVPEKEAQSIMQKVTEKLPGYLVPKLVREVAGQKNKSLIPTLQEVL